MSQLRIKILCNWTRDLHLIWNKMLSRFLNIKLVSSYVDNTNDIEYYIVINGTNEYHEPSKTFLFYMEPFIYDDVYKQNINKYLKIYHYIHTYNNIEWHLSLNIDDLVLFHPKKTKTLSTIISSKYSDVGQRLRVDFVYYINSYINIHVYGDNNFSFNIKKLPYHVKDEGLFEYKYHFNAENNSIPNYFTEKIIDAILAECLCFYWGCPNISTYIDSNAYITLDLNNKEESLNVIKRCIEQDEWSKRIHVIRREKFKILNQMNMFPRILKDLNIINTINIL